MKSRNEYVSQMRNWIGLNERSGSHKVIIDTYNSCSSLPGGYKVKYTDAWCATTVSAAAIRCGYTNIIPVECSCQRMIDLFKKMGRWIENDAYVPKEGDIIFYDWDDNGVGDCTGWADHVGVVESVISNTITVIEGNCNGAVARRNIKVNARYIRGYGVPAYDEINTKPGYMVMINTTALKIRADHSALSPCVGYLHKGETYTIVDEKNGFGKLKSGAGWISLKYTKRM